MKKIIFMVATVIALASCDSKQAPKATGTGVDSANVETVAKDTTMSVLNKQLETKDPVKLQTALKTVETKYEELVKEGKTEEAKSYAEKVKSFITEHSNQIKSVTKDNSTLSKFVDVIGKLPAKTTTAVSEAAGKATDAANSAVDNATKQATDKTNETVDNATKQTDETAKTTKQKAIDAAKSAVKNKLGL